MWQTGSGHPVEHERQRGHLQPGIQLVGGDARHQAAGPPQRPRQHGRSPPTTRSRPRCTSPRTRWPPRGRSAGAEAAAGRHRRQGRGSGPDVVKIGRTHLEDAVPLTVGQEWSGYAGAARRRHRRGRARHRTGCWRLAMGGTAVGTGLNAPPGFGEQVAAQIAALTGHAVRRRRPTSSPRRARWTRWSARTAGCKAAAVTLFKIANDMRWLGSGPRTGLGELMLPGERAGLLDHAGQGQPDPGRGHADGLPSRSSPHDTAVTMAGAEGNFELNAFRPDPDQQLPALGADPGRHVRPLPRVPGRGRRAQPGQADARTSTGR